MKWIIRITNDHQHLSEAEVEHFLGSEHVQWINELLAEVECSEQQMDILLKYSFSVRMVLENPIFVNMKTSRNNIKETLRDIKLPSPPSTGNFSARFTQVINKHNSISSVQIERILGEIVLDQFSGLKVNLDNPDIKLYMISWGKQAAIGWVHATISYSEIGKRAPKKAPFFGGGAMKPLLCRILVNLHYPFAGRIIDPFCGQGGILREMAHTKNYGIGVEVSQKVIRECKINNEYFNLDCNTELVLGDSLHPPFRKQVGVKIVTDPPYAIQTTTKGRGAGGLINSWLSLQEKDTDIIFTLPSTIEVNIENGNVEWEIPDFVHKSLTRIARKVIIK